MTFYEAALASFIAAIFAGAVKWFIDRHFSRLAELISRRGVGKQIPKNLTRYLYHLSTRTLHISHPWMKEGQTLGDILVPVGLFLEGHRRDLRSLLPGFSQ